MTEPDPLLTMGEAVDVCRELAPSGRIGARTLRTLRERGALRTCRLAGRVYTTRAWLVAMIEAAKCPAPENPSGSRSDQPAATEPPSGSSSTADASRALAAARATLAALSPSSRPTSPADIVQLSERRRASTRSSSQTS